MSLVAHPLSPVSPAAIWFESEGHWCSFRGEKATDALNGLVTNDVASLKAGESVYAAALSPKGKMIADLLVARVDAATLYTHALPSSADAWMTLVRKYINPRLCKVTDERDRLRSWWLYGGDASSLVADVFANADVQSFRVPNLGNLEGFVMVSDETRAPALLQMVASAGITVGSAKQLNVLRVEAGIPIMGVDMDDTTIPQEANLDTLGAISFSKGCYTGQETVARLHFRGHVNKQLRGLLASAPFARGSDVVDASGKNVGDVRSVAESPRVGFIALAMIRREVNPGDEVSVVHEGKTLAAQVVELPFPQSPRA